MDIISDCWSFQASSMIIDTSIHVKTVEDHLIIPNNTQYDTTANPEMFGTSTASMGGTIPALVPQKKNECDSNHPSFQTVCMCICMYVCKKSEPCQILTVFTDVCPPFLLSFLPPSLPLSLPFSTPDSLSRG